MALIDLSRQPLLILNCEAITCCGVKNATLFLSQFRDLPAVHLHLKKTPQERDDPEP
jgi:hypothetical protein